MKNLLMIACLMAGILILPETTHANGGAAGVSPFTNVKVVFRSGGSDVWLKFQGRVEWHPGDDLEDNNHAVGTGLSYDIGTSFTPNFGAITPYYHYHFNDAKESGPYVGGYLDVGFRSMFNVIGVGGAGGYQHFFSERLGVYGEAGMGYATIGGNGFSGRSGGFDLDINVGLKVNF